jgi:hypothetical protein
MIDFIKDFLTFPWYLFSTFFVYGFGLVVYFAIFELCRHYRPWETVMDFYKDKKHDYTHRR